MRPPILINNFGDILIYSSVAEAEDDLEPIDVLENEYSGYDSQGQLLTLTVVAGSVRILPDETSGGRPDELATLLRNWLQRPSIALSIPDTMSLVELIQERERLESQWSSSKERGVSTMKKISQWFGPNKRCD